MESLDVIDLGNNFFLVRFYNFEDMDFAITEGFWKPDFNPYTATIDNIAILIRLLGFAIEYYNRTILEKIENIVGRTLKVDMNTVEISGEKFARICVEVNLADLLVS
ncbi:hypothetical protein Ahy_A05g024684 [Arachis hypogaea]|uniref:Uncharacterized protein n=1 Tax=Arachis hypogaea TaxID=3818 RepID=A0A445D726_ARAHY|nr:hypothetical protein Ahy_A05g024684 [Arachis hypogaea]